MFLLMGSRRTAQALQEGCREYGSKAGKVNLFTAPSCIGMNTRPRPTPASKTTRASMEPLRESTRTRLPWQSPSFSAPRDNAARARCEKGAKSEFLPRGRPVPTTKPQLHSAGAKLREAQVNLVDASRDIQIFPT